MTKISKLPTYEGKNKIIDPCFINVWAKEMQKEEAVVKTRLKQVDKRASNLTNISDSCELTLQGAEPSDGIMISVDGVDDSVDEELLDYVDDVVDNEELVELSGEATTLVAGTSKTGEITQQLTDEELANNPRVKNLFNLFWEEKMKEMKRSEETGRKSDSDGAGKADEGNLKTKKSAGQSPLIKSPSDTTIYAPALKQKLNKPIDGLPVVLENELPEGNQSQINQMISNFVDNVRLEQVNRDNVVDLQERERRKASSAPQQSNEDLEDAQSRASRAVIEAEKFRASLVNPGMLESVPQAFDNQLLTQEPDFQRVNLGNIPNIGSGVSDDDFFHLTCHIEPGLIHKIEKGEFVELEKLVPKDKHVKGGEDNRLEWVQKDGGTFLVPAVNKDNKISSFRKWEQAFRAYATIYCGANSPPIQGKFGNTSQ